MDRRRVLCTSLIHHINNDNSLDLGGMIGEAFGEDVAEFAAADVGVVHPAN